MRTRAARTTIAAAVLGALLAAGSAQAAQIQVDRACYPGSGLIPVKLTGSGYAPNADYLVLVNGGVVGSGTADPSGFVNYELTAPAPPDSGTGANDAGFHVEVNQGDTKASTDFRSARVLGDFNPGDGNPATLKVSFSAFGFGIDRPAGTAAPQVYVHYVNPKGKVKRTISLGKGQGTCGSIRRTSKRKLFPFTPSNGRWALQFDTNKRYVKGTRTSRFPWDRLTLTID
jgi:hypothetical protein